MLAKRIIPCLDTIGENVVKGRSFENLQVIGPAIEFAERYEKEGADELVLLDITATLENRKTFLKLVEDIAKRIFIPLTVGGGIKSIEDIRNLLRAGADKVSLNTFAVLNPEIINRVRDEFGSQCLVIAVDAKRISQGKWEVYIKSGKESTGIDVFEWLREVQNRGAGEILLTSIDADGHRRGYDLDLIKRASSILNIPLIASGGAGSLEDLYLALMSGADAVLAASIFHYGEYTVKEVKDYLKNKNVHIREV
ncbi:MAG: imidazole glycerol phosphate synthase subunit HisF [Dictyoglomus sp. NZ13-RE01]|nr:MAG: imidazole glycerol phosphate synthase subunit HisF [Dictyoglomus sp. NZ13-RE01]